MVEFKVQSRGSAIEFKVHRTTLAPPPMLLAGIRKTDTKLVNPDGQGLCISI